MRLCLLGFIGALVYSACLGQEIFEKSAPLRVDGDLSAQMIAGIDKFLSRELNQSIARRNEVWHYDFASFESYEASVSSNRFRLKAIIGAVDRRLPVSELDLVATSSEPSLIGETDQITIQAVRWPVFPGVHGEGLWLRPKGQVRARIIAIPDADQTPEMIAGLAEGLAPERQFARRLAGNGCEVLVVLLIDRSDTFSGNPMVRFTNQPHREWIHRQAFQLGRHMIGYEVQKALAAVDFLSQNGGTPGIVGYGEGGLIAFYAAAIDTRIKAALVSGYFGPRENIWQEPIYRNVFGLLHEFGDAELATLVAPRTLIIEHSDVPDVKGPPAAREGRSGAAQGKLLTPDYAEVETEFERSRAILNASERKAFDTSRLITGTEGLTTGPCSDRALLALLDGLGAGASELAGPGTPPQEKRKAFDPVVRQLRQFKELEEYTQRMYRDSERIRKKVFWDKLAESPSGTWPQATAHYRTQLLQGVIGQLPSSKLPLNPRMRKLPDRPQWTGYEIMLDVFPDVYAWGYLLVPKNLNPGERRPVVVCQHGLEGLPGSVIDENQDSRDFKAYKAFGARLAERGFVVFAPHNPYRGGDQFRMLQRKANPVGTSIFSVIVAQHSRILEWLSLIPFVDPERIGFYGLSYGGKTAMRVPAVINGYALSVCSGDFNEWVRKTVSLDFKASYMFTQEWEMLEWNIGNTFNYAEMAALIAPRPFMVERGHSDPVGLDEWAAYEYAKVDRLYDSLEIGDRTTIEFFNGGHTINGQGTFEFLHKHLGWPEPK